MKKGTRFHRVPCSYCGKEIGRNMMDYHIHNKCPDYCSIKKEQDAQKEKERIEWARTANISDPKLTFGDLLATGRMGEWKIYAETCRILGRYGETCVDR